MATPSETRRTPLVIVAVAVCMASVAVSVFFGLWAAAGYVPWQPEGSAAGPVDYFMGSTGGIAGGVGGVLAGLCWCQVIVRPRLRGGARRDSVVGAGCAWGALMGVLATVVLHGTLLVVAPMAGWPISPNLALIVGSIGLFCGVVAGGLLGLLSGAVCDWVVKLGDPGEPSISLPPTASE